MDYPRWSYFPRRTQAPAWADGFSKVVAANKSSIESFSHSRLTSDRVLELLRADLELQGWTIESGRRTVQKIYRPVLFGDENEPRVQYQIDGWHEEHKAVLEIESGRGWMGNAFFRDLVRTSLIHDARFLVIGLRLSYNYGTVKAQNDYEKARAQLDAVFASGRLELPFEGILLFGW